MKQKNETKQTQRGMAGKKLAILVLALMLSVSMYGCKGTEDKKTDTKSSTNAESAQGTVDNSNTADGSSTADAGTADGTEAAETVYPVTVTGSDGTELTIEAEPEKIISLGPNITEILYAIGAEDKLKARTDYCDYPEGVSSIESIGSLQEPDLEKIISLEPDLVIASTHVSDDMKTQLEAAKIPMLYLYEEHEISGVLTMVTTLGSAVNKNTQAKAVTKEMQEKMSQAAEAVEGLEPVSVYYVVGFGETEYTAGGDTFINGILTAAGGKNIAADISGWEYSTESLLEADPEVILMADYNYDAFTTTEPYSQLSAVKNGKVYKLDTNMLDRQCPRNADAVLEIAGLLHPEAFK